MSYKIFTLNQGVEEGALVQKYHLKGSDGIFFPAILVGEEGRNRKLGILPVELLPEQRQEWDEKGEIKIAYARVAYTRTGHPKLISCKGETSDEKIIGVFRTPIGYRGHNAHTGDYIPSEDDFAPFPGESLVHGVIAQGNAGRMGCGIQYVALIPKGIVFRTAYSGRLYGAPPEHYYLWTGERMLCATSEEREVAELF